jgi:hypothetical protein
MLPSLDRPLGGIGIKRDPFTSAGSNKRLLSFGRPAYGYKSGRNTCSTGRRYVSDFVEVGVALLISLSEFMFAVLQECSQVGSILGRTIFIVTDQLYAGIQTLETLNCWTVAWSRMAC